MVCSVLIARKFYGQVDGASDADTVDLGLIPGPVKPKTIKLVFTASLLEFSIKRDNVNCEASTVCGGQVAA